MSDINYRFNAPKGNEHTKNLIINELENHALTHALLLEGDEGTGKKTLAIQLACAIACSSDTRPCGKCEVCKKILANKCTDVKYIDVPDDKKSIVVSQIRELKNDVCTLPGETEYKIYIITEADKMNVEAQNAFLKILEEPPSYAYFILLCESSVNLLPTVKSRVQTLKTELFDADTLDEMLTADLPNIGTFKENSPAAYDSLLLLCRGSYGKLLTSVKSAMRGKGVKNDFIFELLQSLAKDRKAAYLIHSKDIPTDRTEYRAFLDGMLGAIRDLIANRHRCTVNLTLTRSDLTVLSALYPERVLARLYGLIYAMRVENQSNINISLSSMHLLTRMWQIVRIGK